MFWRRKELLDYFERNERYAAPMLGNLLSAGFMNLPGRLRCGDYFFVRRDGELYGVAAIFNDGNMMVCLSAPWTEEILNLTAAMDWHTLWDYSFEPSVGLRLKSIPGVYELRPLILMERDTAAPLSPIPESIEIIRADMAPGDPGVTLFIRDCMRECFSFDPDMRAVRKRLTERTRDEWYLIGAVNGVRAAQAHIQAWTPRYGVIGGVGTLRLYRGRGLARAVTTRLCSYIEESGRVPILTVDRGNETAIALYRSLGFREVNQTFACHRRT
ncbi:MAG: GNAT family N-acetyltransferase [Clostridiales bacterium]|nr:GNAT family N-acetyltransferase [Clostridiales bacterium]